MCFTCVVLVLCKRAMYNLDLIYTFSWFVCYVIIVFVQAVNVGGHVFASWPFL